MPIDGVGRKGPVAPRPPEGEGGARATSPTRDFELRPPAAAPAGAVEGVGLTPLDRVRSGALTPSEYVELKVEQATSHLTGLSPPELESIRGALRERIATDPALADLVRTATGAAPSPPRDE